MTPRASLLQLGKLVAKDIARGKLSQGSRDVGDALASYPDAMMEVLDLLITEFRKKRPSSSIISAFMFMLKNALESARWRIENQSGCTTDVIDKVRATILDSAERKRLSAENLMMIAHCFAAAKLDIGDDLRQIAQTLAYQTPKSTKSEAVIVDFEKVVAKLAAELDHDPFLIHAQLAELFAGMSVDQRMEMISTLCFTDLPSVREAAPGWLLDADVSLANAIAGFLAQAAAKGLVSGATVSRLINMRNWVSDNLRPAIDTIIRAARQNGGGVALSSPIEIKEVMASSCDGAGAQSYFVATRQKRKSSVAGLLFKHGFGIRDAWVLHGMTGGEAEAFLDKIDFEMGCFQSSLDAVQTVLAHGLAVNAEANEPIPFGLLQFMEATGLPAVAPQYLKPEELLARLFDEMPKDKQSQASLSRALSRSKRWMGKFSWLNSWFEGSEAALQAMRSGKTIKARTEAVLHGVIEEHRKRWAELLAWTALAARDEVDNDDWIDFTLVARELLGERPISDIPLASIIALTTIAALKDQLRSESATIAFRADR